MEQLMQEKMSRARRNLKWCGWMMALCALVTVAGGILFVSGKLEWQIFVDGLLSLGVFGLLTYNNRRILQGKRPWGDF